MPHSIKVDIWSDVACPWCYIGKRRFAAGLEEFRARNPGTQVLVEYHSFELAPDTPVDFEGSEVDFLVGHKGIAPDQAKAMLMQVKNVAAGVGLDYDFDAVRHTKTLAAHELLHFAKARGRQAELKERLLRAYFSEGRHVGRHEELADLAAEAGLDREEALRALDAGEYRAHVEADMDNALQLGVNGVPFYVLDGRFAIAGAQPPELFAKALEHARAERAEAA